MTTREEIGFLFDLDGVLIDSETEYTRIWATINNRIPTGVERFEHVIKGMTLLEILNKYFSPCRHNEVIDMLNSMEQQMRYEMLPGAAEILDILCALKIKRALVTSSNELKLQHLREEIPWLESRFNYIVTADKISHSKPHPEGYLQAAEMLGVDPRCCVVFEDSAQGVKAGKAAECYVVGLSTTLPASQLSNWCDKIVNNLSETNVEDIVKILRNRL
ncbi:MAG: HAD-IA family hydrolase [Candidatus Amulumruptor caecigallinarius]|nr:HAD-IA family hydrolase [Candidatus Amulumruptor caecigallinarius]